MAGLAVLLATGGAVALYWLLTATPPTHAQLHEINRVPSVTLYDRHGERLAVRGAFHGDMLTLEEMPDYLPAAFLAIEDRRFYHHNGIDFRGLARALWVNLRAGRTVQGGSTITQQLAKNLFLTPERTLWRKIEELGYALWLERHLEKEEILALYMNRIYLGAGTYGVDAAARFYFDVSARDVTLAQAAMLAALPKAPSRFAPTSDLMLARARAETVLDALVDAGFASEGDVYAARVDPAAPMERAGLEGVQYFVDAVIAEAARHSGAPFPTDVIIHTTLDPKLQRQGEDAVVEALARDGESLDAGQAALIAMEPSGAVRAMVGGRSYGESQFNRATQARRQPGSAFKPFVYLAALEHGIRPEDVYWDEPIEVEGWAPRNYGGGFQGRVTVRQAVERSINTVAVRVSEEIGRDRAVEVAQRLGIRSPLEANRSIALGTSEVSLIELAGAYAAFAREGLAAEPHIITRIETERGEVLYERAPPEEHRVMERAHAHQMTNMLHQVMLTGTGRAARFGRWPAAGKTGTSQEWRDAWFIGYTAELVTGVWVGNDDDSPMARVAGGGLPAHIWRDFMSAAHEGRAIAALPGAHAVRDVAAHEDLRRFFNRLSSRFAEAQRDERPRDRDRRGWWPW
jgi:penicillin-binding protein 1A